jgi:hypothetical protein
VPVGRVIAGNVGVIIIVFREVEDRQPTRQPRLRCGAFERVERGVKHLLQVRQAPGRRRGFFLREEEQPWRLVHGVASSEVSAQRLEPQSLNVPLPFRELHAVICAGGIALPQPRPVRARKSIGPINTCLELIGRRVHVELPPLRGPASGYHTEREALWSIRRFEKRRRATSMQFVT